MNNELSFESIFNMGVGNKPVAAVDYTASEERFDGNMDAMFADLARSEEELNFLETFESIESFNNSQKLRMLAKINKEYGKCNRGIENYCREQSLEAEVDGTSAKKEEVVTKDKPKDAPKTWKHMKWLQTALHAIANFFVKIWQAIKNFFVNLASKIKGFFTKKKAEKIAKEADNKLKETPAASTTTSTSSTTSVNPKLEKNVTELIKMVSGNIAKITPYTVKLNKLVGSISFNAGGDGPNDQFKLRWKEECSTVAMAAVKLLSQVSKLVMKGGQAISDCLKTPEKVKIVGSNDFGTYTGMFISAVNDAEGIVKQIQDNNFKNSSTGNKEADKAYNDVVAVKRKAIGTSAYKIYDTASKMAKKYAAHTAQPISSTDFTSPSTSGKKMGDVLKKLAQGMTVEDNAGGTRQKFILKNLFGVEVSK